MRSSVLLQSRLPLFLALVATAILPITTLGGDAAAVGAYQARRVAASAASNPISYGADGRLTVLLLGSDYRPDLYGERMDVVMVLTIDPATRRIAIANIPRDTVYIPRAASNGGGTSGTNRINAMYSVFYRTSYSVLKHPYVDMKALKEFKADVATMLGTEIDYVAMARFGGVVKLIDVIGGVDVSIAAAIRDSFYQAPGETNRNRGVFFPKSTSWHLAGKVKCQPYPKKCHNALAYARSRHGSVGTGYNSDFARARRQQLLIKAVSDKVVQLGSDNLPTLVSWVRKPQIYTDLPHSLDAATQMYDLVNGATVSPHDVVVFSPSKWATENSTTPIYTFRPKLHAVRAWINQHFGS